MSAQEHTPSPSGQNTPAYEHVHDEKAMTKLVQNAALSNATSLQRPSFLTWGMLMLSGCLLIATFNSCINGYDGSLMGAINSYPQFREYFNFPRDGGTPSTGIVYAIYTIGNLIGSFAAGPATDFRGRRVGMFIGGLVIVLGTCVQATAHNLAAFMIGIYNSFWFIGGIPGTFVPYGTSTIAGTNPWRIPIWLQMTFSGLVVVFTLFLPEIPRWLMANDSTEEALDVMVKYHGEGDRKSPIVQLEYEEMRIDISKTGSDKRWWDYRELFNSREVRYRTMLVVFMAFFGQWSGNGPVKYYYPQMLQGAGITDNHTRLLYNGCQNVVSFGGAAIGAIFKDRWGRLRGLLVRTTGTVVICYIITALNATNTYTAADSTILAKSPASSKADIASIFIFGFVYSAGWTPLQALYPVNVLRYESREKGMGFYNFWDCLEAANRTLEGLADIFRSKNPVAFSLKKTKGTLIKDKQGNEVHEIVEKSEAS
ncbi:hypothetical protein BGZ57DRAFT_1019822 [Hyaloscypha finlandica]|nr:hypothetical protein BGZ57DRAFT_1019822 [Hyaloscypha finlandica]